MYIYRERSAIGYAAGAGRYGNATCDLLMHNVVAAGWADLEQLAKPCAGPSWRRPSWRRLGWEGAQQKLRAGPKWLGQSCKMRGLRVSPLKHWGLRPELTPWTYHLALLPGLLAGNILI